MTNELKVIHEQGVLGKEFKVYGDNKNPLFLAKDVADWIEHNQVARMIELVDEDEKLKCLLSTSGQNREMWFLTEGGLYEVLMQSRKPIAKEFKKEVKLILKSIRKNGAYMTEQTLERTMADPDFLIGLLTNLKEEQQARKQAEKVIEEQKPKVAFAESVDVSVNSITVSQLAKLISQKGVSTGQNRLFEWLRDNGYLVKSGRNKNNPTQRYVDQGLFEIKTGSIIKPSGESHTTRTTLVTGKGQIYFINKFLN